MELLALNDDVLLLICSHLSARDAFSLSLSSKKARQIAFKRSLSSAECVRPAQLRELTAYMCAVDPTDDIPRASYLESLVVHVSTFFSEVGGPSHEADRSDEGEYY